MGHIASPLVGDERNRDRKGADPHRTRSGSDTAPPTRDRERADSHAEGRQLVTQRPLDRTRNNEPPDGALHPRPAAIVISSFHRRLRRMPRRLGRRLGRNARVRGSHIVELDPSVRVDVSTIVG